MRVWGWRSKTHLIDLLVVRDGYSARHSRIIIQCSINGYLNSWGTRKIAIHIWLSRMVGRLLSESLQLLIIQSVAFGCKISDYALKHLSPSILNISDNAFKYHIWFLTESGTRTKKIRNGRAPCHLTSCMCHQRSFLISNLNDISSNHNQYLPDLIWI